MEIPHPEHNSRNSVRRLTCTKLKCYTTLIRRETLVPQKEASHHAEPKSGKPINVVHVSSTFAPSLTTAIIFRRLGSHDRYRKRGLHLPIDEKKLVKVQGCCHKTNARREYKRLQTTERLIYLFILPRNEGLSQKIQTAYTDTLN